MIREILENINEEAISKGLSQEATQLLQKAKENIQQLNITKILDYADRIAKFDNSSTIEAQHLAEALQYREIDPVVNSYRFSKFFQKEEGLDTYRRMEELGIVEELDKELPILVNNIKSKLTNLDNKAIELFKSAERFFESDESGLLPTQITVRELKRIDNVLDKANEIRESANATEIEPLHLAEALQGELE